MFKREYGNMIKLKLRWAWNVEHLREKKMYKYFGRKIFKVSNVVGNILLK
jgi:hypothetical protein